MKEGEEKEEEEKVRFFVTLGVALLYFCEVAPEQSTTMTLV